jgi:hypothetical protein
MRNDYDAITRGKEAGKRRDAKRVFSLSQHGSLTQWGEALIKRTAVEQLHRLHL